MNTKRLRADERAPLVNHVPIPNQLQRSIDASATGALLAFVRSSALPFTPKQLVGMIQLACASLALVTCAAYAQNTGPISQSSSGQDAPAESGWQGGTPNNLNFNLQQGSVVGDSSSNASVSLTSSGGAGGTGKDGGSPTGSGGAGGASGQISFTVVDGSGVLTSSTAPAAVVLTSNGGSGGTAGKMSASAGTPGVPGSGGNSGGIQFTQSGSIISNNGWNGTTPGTTAVLMTANGGAGAEPLDSDGTQGGGSQHAPAGGSGGAGGSIVYTLTRADVQSGGSGIVALSQGGQGGDGYGAYSTDGSGYGGNGGAGGNGGSIQISAGQSGSVSTIAARGAPTASTGAVIPIDAAGDTAQAAVMAAGILAQSLGGVGGAGGTGDGTVGGKAGSGGAAGDAGQVVVNMGSSFINTTGFAAAGILAQSIGGAGGNGAGAGGTFSRHSGNGGDGGAGGPVSIGVAESPSVRWPSSVISTTGDDSMGVVAQSIGGGGGAGGSVQAGSIIAGVSIGGDGESGGVASPVTLNNGALAAGSTPALAGFIVSTQGEHSSGLVAQSIGGGGGTGGSATNTVLGPFAYTVGGSGGSGGNAGTPGTTQVSVLNQGIVSTAGNHAKGVVGQAVGGGGGDGGSAQAIEAGAIANINVTVGGNGGTGGSAGDVSVTNSGEILTSGSDAWGLLSQSVAGGGGNGGMSKSQVYQLAANTPVPNIVINATIGGSGGDGSPSGNVTAINNNVIMTAGPAAHGILAQSVSGGGGNGGDSSAVTAQAGKGASIDITIALGGRGGQGGAAGNVTVDNAANALIWTLGDSANGIFAQSVGGGGGSGGTGTADTLFLGKKVGTSGSYAAKLGGSGGSGANGGSVIVTNEGNVMTMGDSASGIFAQSIGSGGGLSTGGTAKGSSGKLSQSMTLGAGGAASGNGGAVSATNNATILTFGGDSPGIFAQSVGGGGGKSGVGTTAGLPEPTVSLADYLASSSALKSSVASYGGVQAWGPGGWILSSQSQMESWGNDYLAYAATQPSGLPPDGSGGVVSVNANVGSGSSAGPSGGSSAAGDGGTVNATNNFAIQTFGPASAGIVAQSVGGGGGVAGASAVNLAQTSSNGGMHVNTSINVGGNANGNLGNGGAVTITNNGSIATGGDASFGVAAQSVGAGGGQTLVTGATYASDTSASTPILINLGGGNGTTGNGGAVTVNHTGGTRQATISTTGSDAVGIVAQSIGGGGGNVIVMQTTANAAGNSMGTTNPNAGSTVGLSMVAIDPFKGEYNFGTAGDGGAVTVNTSSGSTVNTAGRNAHGILTQSIGGGGGWVVGLSTQATSPFTNADGEGAGGNVAVNQAGVVKTTGDGAYGVLAQSIGGAGVLGGDLATAATRVRFGKLSPDEKLPGSSGGNVTIVNSGTVTTTGANAHAIFAQSVGGGGGLWSMAGGGVMMGSFGGPGDSGVVNITNSGFVQASGMGSSAIYVNTQGQRNNSLVGVNNTGTVWGNSAAPAIMFTGGNSNGDGSLSNSGFVANTNGTAVSAPDSFAAVTNSSSGQIYGNMNLGARGTFTNSGFWGTNDSSSGTITNIGTLNIWGANFNQLGVSSLNGTLVNSGVIQSSVDFYNNKSSYLQVSGAVALENGTSLMIRPTTLNRTAVAVLHAGEPIEFPTLNPQPIGVTDPGGNFVFAYQATFPDFQTLAVLPTTSSILYRAGQGTSNQNLLALAASLDTNWSNNTISSSLSQTYASLATIKSSGTLVDVLSNLSSESASAAAVSHLGASNAFVERMNSCPRFEGEGLFQREHDCVWGRTIASNTDQSASSESIGYRQSGNVFQLGGQKEIAPDWFVGGSVSADNTSLSTRTVGESVSGKGWTAGLVVKHQMGDWLVSGALTGGRMSYDSSRQVQIPGISGTASASFDVSHVGIHSRISRQFAYEQWYLKPYVDLHATHVQTGRYTEQGAGPLNLRASASSTNVLSASPMLEAGTRFDLSNGMTLQAYAGIGAAFYNQGGLGADFQFADSAPGSSSFHTTSDLPHGRLKMTAGLDLSASERLNVRLEYSGEFASSFRSNTAALKATYKF